MGLKLAGVAVLATIIVGAAILHRAYSAGVATAELRAVAESAKVLAREREKASERAEKATSALAKATARADANLALARKARAKLETQEQCPDACYLRQPSS